MKIALTMGGRRTARNAARGVGESQIQIQKEVPLKLKLFAIALLVAGAASAQLNPRIPLAGTPGISPSWITGGTQMPLGAFPLTPLPIFTAPPALPFYDSTSTRIGNFTFFQDSLGTSGTSTRLGNFTFSNYSNGGQTTSCTSNRLGTMVYTNCF